MAKRFFLFAPALVLALCLSVSTNAQTPKNVILQQSNGPESVACPPGMQNDAGTVQAIVPMGANSNDIDLDTAFLCFCDTVLIDHVGDMDLSGDPVPATPPGVGYGFYDCPPTISGPDIDTISTDPCITNNPPPAGPLWIAPSPLAGDLLFWNKGFLQDSFNNGNPILLWFAPITYDALDLVSFNPQYEGNPAGPCVNVSTDQAFAVVYLNQIEVVNLDVMAGGSNCVFTFNLEGGYPEFAPSAFNTYDIEVTKKDDPSVEGWRKVLPSLANGYSAEVNVPLAGIYTVKVTDGKSCPLEFDVDMSACDEVTMDISEEVGFPGDTVCVSFVAQDFIDILSFQFQVFFDTSVLEFIPTVFNIHPNLGLNTIGVGPAAPNDDAVISVNYLDLTFTPVTVPDGDTLFQFCFILKGNVGDVGDIVFDYTEFPIPIEVRKDGPNLQGIPKGLNGLPGSITIIDTVSITLESKNISCGEVPPNPPVNDGQITLTVHTGTEPYSVFWQQDNNPVQGPDTIFNKGDSLVYSNLGPGTYYFTVISSGTIPDTLIDSVVITEPGALGVGPDIANGFQNPQCFGDSTGAFPITVNGGTAPFSYLWNTGDTIEDLFNLPAGFYDVTVTDDNGCTAVAGLTLANPNPLVLSVNSMDATCSGTMDGQATAVPNGGTIAGDYMYEWSTTPVQNIANITNLDIGKYYITVTDDNGCTVTDSADISAATILLANALTTDVKCFGGSDGNIFTNPSAIGVNNGGYTFTWLPAGTAGVNDNNATGLQAGTYQVIITDIAGCSIDSTYTLIQPDSLVITLDNKTDETCITGNDGTITVTASGGTLQPGGDYEYDWNSGQMTNAITNLSAGIYTVTVTDDNECKDSLTVTISAPIPPVIDSFQVMDVLCATSTDGQATVFATQGAAPITGYAWSSNDMMQTATGLAPGTYTVTVTADDGCTAVDSATVGSPPPLSIIDTIIDDPICIGDCNGNLSFQVGGGTPPYSFMWSNGGTTNPIVGLCAGTYTATITDANDCQIIVSATLTDPPPVTIDFSNLTPTSCVDLCDGSATATASGGGAGTGIYSYTWSSGESDPLVATSTAVQLCPGINTVTAADADGCQTTDTVIIDSPDSILLDEGSPAFEVIHVTCNGGNDGSATVAAMGGTPPYTYFWPTQNVNGPTVTNLFPGTYPVQITDASGCMFTGSVTITEPDPFTLELDTLASSFSVTCPDDQDAIITVVPVGGNPGAINYNWSGNVANTNQAVSLPPGTYSVTATDSKGCTAALQHTISEPPPLIVEIPTPVPPLCNGGNSFFSIDTAFGGNGGPFTYLVDNFSELPIDQPRNVLAGGVNHLITIIDALGCRLDTMILFPEPPPVLVDLGPDVEIELGEFLELSAIPTLSLLPIDSVLWTPPDVQCVDTFGGLCFDVIVSPGETTTYTVTVIDTNGCIGTDEITVTIDKNRNIYIPNVFSPNGDGRNDFFRVFAGAGVENIKSMQVYDRWGELIYQANNFLPGLNTNVVWDGSFKGKKMNPAVFVYLIDVEFIDGLNLLYRGTVTLVR